VWVPERNGVVSDEDEWDGADEMRRAAKTVRLRNYPPAKDHVFD